MDRDGAERTPPAPRPWLRAVRARLAAMTKESVLLLGRDETRLGAWRQVELADGATAAALSVGGDPNSPARASKGDPAEPNEDALFALDDGRFCLFAVADAHHGIESSHRLLELLADAVDSPALERKQLNALVESLHDRDGDPEGRSECAFLITVFDRESGRGFGLSWGDASLMVVEREGLARLANEHDHRWVTPARPVDLASWRAKPFRFEAGPGSLVLAYTDGVDCCEYGSPATSIGPAHLQELMALTGPNPQTSVRRLTELALAGVGGHPGGQDNIAIIGVRA